jgi:hypothetical protein
MHPQLEAIDAEFRSAQDRLHALVRQVPEERWRVRGDPRRWSVGECVEHLNLTGRAYLPILEIAVAEARALRGPGPRRYRRDLIGWLLWKGTGPPVRLRTRTSAPFIPAGLSSPDALVAEFDRLQAAQLGQLHAADGTPMERVRVTSPFDSRIAYNLFACFGILPRHQHRHLWQAEGVWGR